VQTPQGEVLWWEEMFQLQSGQEGVCLQYAFLDCNCTAKASIREALRLELTMNSTKHYYRRLDQAEKLIACMRKAWAHHLPHVNLQDAVRQLEQLADNGDVARDGAVETPETQYDPAGRDSLNELSPDQCNDAEAYEFDESNNFGETTDGMGSLVTEPGKVGYTGPQSGVAALKFLQTLLLYTPSDQPKPFHLDEANTTDTPAASYAEISRYVNDYFKIYHTSYPILHEGTFRARVSGMSKTPINNFVFINSTRSACQTTRWIMAIVVQYCDSPWSLCR
jgi:hypothetical protein